MATEFLMPKLGLTMEEGKIVEWLVSPGTAVDRGTPVLRIETDKVESDVEAPAAGRLHPLVGPGAAYKCGARIGWLLAEGETVPADEPGPASNAPDSPATPAPAPATVPEAGRRFVSPNARRVAAELGVDLAVVQGTGPGGRIVSEDVEAAAPQRAISPSLRKIMQESGENFAELEARRGPGVAVTGAARQLADLLGIDLAVVAPDAVDGRVTREAVARHVRERLGTTPAPRPAPAPASAAPAAPAPKAVAAPMSIASMPLAQTPTKIQKLTGTRGTIAKRMHASLQEMAQLTLMMDADMDAVVADRARRQTDGPAPSYTDYIVAATARALRQHPIVNSQVTEQGIALLPEIHVGVAVAVPTGLLVPVVRNADRLTLTELAAETSRLADLGRNGKLKLPDLEGGTFSVSALGMFGVDGFTPVINPPNVAILGVGRLRDEVVLRDGAVATGKRLTFSLTWDHRVFDGVPAAQFTQTIVKLLADPSTLERLADPAPDAN